MDNNTHAIKLDTVNMPVLTDCGILTAATPFVHVDRTADFNVMICVMQGVIYVTEDDTDHTVHEKEVLFLKSGVHHFGKYEIPRGTKWFYAHFLTGDTKLSDINESAPGGECSFILPKKVPVNRLYFEKLQDLCNIFNGTEVKDRLKKNSYLYDVLTELVLQESIAPETLSGRICEFLSTQLDRAYTRELIEDEFFLSYSYMSAVFLRETGTTPGSWHNEARMKKACELLRSTDMTVGEIAAALGFEDPLYFSRKFKNAIGFSPALYRKKALERY